MILTQTPYGKDDGDAAGASSSSLAELAGESDYLIERGYIQVVADVRGTGGSEGEWGLFDPVQGTDGATLVNWAAALPHSDGDVGPARRLLPRDRPVRDRGRCRLRRTSRRCSRSSPATTCTATPRSPAASRTSSSTRSTSGSPAASTLLLPAYEGNSDLVTAGDRPHP